MYDYNALIQSSDNAVIIITIIITISEIASWNHVNCINTKVRQTEQGLDVQDEWTTVEHRRLTIPADDAMKNFGDVYDRLLYD